MPLIEVQKIPKPIVDGFKAALARNASWTQSSLQTTKDALVLFLMEAQGSRCAYCKRLIKDEIGLRELDHILPKGASGKVDRAVSNLRVNRRSTVGYHEYRFEPSNLILTCKRCNHRKGNYDCRTDRSVAAPANYPNSAADFEWIHPFHHDYIDHINLLNDFVYQVVPGSNGLALIEACKLGGIEALEARARDHRLKEIKDINKLALQLMIEDLSDDDIVDTVMRHFPKVTKANVRRAVRAFRDNKIT